MNQDKRKFVPTVRLTAHSVRLDWMLFEINHLPDDYDYAGEHDRDRIDEETRRFEKEIKP
jgi:hypothetical protein